MRSKQKRHCSRKANRTVTNGEILFATIAVIGAATILVVIATLVLFPSYYDMPEKLIVLFAIALAGVVSVIGGLKNATELIRSVIGTPNEKSGRTGRTIAQQATQDSAKISVPQNRTSLQNSEYATLKVVSDSFGNVNLNSWGKGTGGNWSHAKNMIARVGDQIKLSATAQYSGTGGIEYRFSLQLPGRGFEVCQDWSLIDSTWTWNVSEDDIGKGVVIMVAVRARKGYHQFNDSDDYTYATYDVLPTPKEK